MICSKCKLDKETTCFASRGKGKLHKQCKECKKEAISRYYQSNKKVYKKRAINSNKKIREAIKNYVQEYKDKPCADCGKKYPHYIMDFDHIRDKKYNVADIVKKCSMKMLLEEIDKCEVVCSNCHRERTWRRNHPGVEK